MEHLMVKLCGLRTEADVAAVRGTASGLHGYRISISSSFHLMTVTNMILIKPARPRIPAIRGLAPRQSPLYLDFFAQNANPTQNAILPRPFHISV